MDKKRRIYWGCYLRMLGSKFLELRDWDIQTTNEIAAGDAIAVARPHYGRKRVTILFSLGFDRDPDWEQRLTCVHELLHAHFSMLDIVIRGVVERYNKNFLLTMKDNTDMQMEFLVDALAGIIAPHVPLPLPDGPEADEFVKSYEAESWTYSSLSVDGSKSGDDDGRAPTPTPASGDSAPASPSPDCVQAPTGPIPRGESFPWAWGGWAYTRPPAGSDESAT